MSTARPGLFKREKPRGAGPTGGLFAGLKALTVRIISNILLAQVRLLCLDSYLTKQEESPGGERGAAIIAGVRVKMLFFFEAMPLSRHGGPVGVNRAGLH